MPPPSPDWALLSPDLWRRIVLNAGRPSPISVQDLEKTDDVDITACEAWWRLVACVSSSCRALRASLLGPEAGELWEWLWFRYTREPGLLELLLRQAHLAQSALVEASSWPLPELQAIMAAITSVQDLTVWHCERGTDIACVSAALPGQLRALHFEGEHALPGSIQVPRLQQLSLKLYALHEPDIKALAGCLPRLQRFELSVTGYLSDDKV